VRRIQTTMGLMLAAAGALLGCAPQNQFVPPPPPKVTVAKPVEREVADSLVFTGWTEAPKKVDLRTRVSGYLDQVLFEDGAKVTEGDLLFVIEQRPFRTALAAAEAELQKAQAALQLATSEYNRAVQLKERNATTQAELDVAAAQLETGKANVAAADAMVRKAKSDLSYTEIRSPITGRIGRHMVDEGNLVSTEQTLLGTVESYDPIYAYFSVGERDLLKYVSLTVEDGGSLEQMEKDPPKLYLGLSNEEEFPREGHFDFSERSIDRQTGTALQRGVFPNPGWTLVPGLFVRIKAPVGTPRPRLLVPERAVSVDQLGDYLMVVVDAKPAETNPAEAAQASPANGATPVPTKVAMKRPAKLGMTIDGMRVVESGVTADDLVIVNGLQRARDGAPVEPEMEGAQPAPAAATTASAAPTTK
jgi:RND family efflux transporter MFP subunit